jgi:glutamate--cysteine ligase
MTAHTFRDFMTHGFQGHRATMSDWSAHLTTLFPEARMKGYIEWRSCDSQAPELMLAVPALAKGLLYDSDCLQASWDLVKAWSWDERVELWHAVHKQALQTRIRRIELAEIARELVAIAIAARAQLSRRARVSRGHRSRCGDERTPLAASTRRPPIAMDTHRRDGDPA